MMPRIRRSAVVAIVALPAALASPPARADDPSCIEAYEQTQALRKASKLRDAREQAAKCARDACPAVLSRDCAKWFTELEQSIPTVTFDVRGSDGFELSNVKVTMDGNALLEKLDGKSVPVDIGAHTFRFELVGANGIAPVERHTIIHEGDKNRKLAVTFRPANSAARPIPIMAFVFGGASAAAILAGGYFALKGFIGKGDIDDCKPFCPADQVNGVSHDYAIADILLPAGLVAGLAAAYIYWTRPAAEPSAVPEQARRPKLDFAARRGGADARFAVEF